MTEIELLTQVNENLIALGNLHFYLTAGLLFGLGWIAGHQR